MPLQREHLQFVITKISFKHHMRIMDVIRLYISGSHTFHYDPLSKDSEICGPYMQIEILPIVFIFCGQ
jgi:hypothetical protein